MRGSDNEVRQRGRKEGNNLSETGEEREAGRRGKWKME